MSHARAQIRAAAAADLTGLATTGARVIASRVFPPGAADHAPALAVYALAETRDADGDDLGGGYVARVLELAIEIRAPHGPAWDDTIDQAAAEVEAALWAAVHGADTGSALRPLVDELEYQGIEIDLGDPDRPYAVALMAFACHYATAAADPETTT